MAQATPNDTGLRLGRRRNANPANLLANLNIHRISPFSPTENKDVANLANLFPALFYKDEIFFSTTLTFNLICCLYDGNISFLLRGG